jgi:cytochrome bd-type quinol oxidase subunit 2
MLFLGGFKVKMNFSFNKLALLLAIPFLFAFVLGPSLKVSAFDLFGRTCNKNSVEGGNGKQSSVCEANNKSKNSNGKDNVVLDSINKAVNIVAVVTGMMAVIMIIIAGFTYATAGGNAEETKNARNRILWSAIGLAIISLAWTITRFITNEVL